MPAWGYPVGQPPSVLVQGTLFSVAMDDQLNIKVYDSVHVLSLRQHLTKAIVKTHAKSDHATAVIAWLDNLWAFVMLLKIPSLVALVAAAVSLLWLKELRLPYPCFKVVQSIPQDQIAAPSDLRGPYSINRHLQKAKKLYEHQIDSVGRRQPSSL